MTNDEKYAQIIETVEKKYPILARVWRQARNFGEAWLTEFIVNLETVYGAIEDGAINRLGDALDGYAEFSVDALRSQVYFERKGHYKHSSHAECAELYYHDEDHMTRCYLPGMWLSHFLWPQHFNMLRMYRQCVLPRVQEAKLFFEVGVGCGMYSKVTLEGLPEATGRGYDISAHSLNFTHNMLKTFGLGERYGIKQMDIQNEDAQADFLICQEVLEHLEDPALFCTWLYNMVKPGGSAYITAALNAAHSDHIYLLRHPGELEEMLRDAGFRPLSGMEELAPVNKPRKITPSLAGFYVERPEA